MTEAAHQMACNPLPPRPRKPGTVGLRRRAPRSRSWTSDGELLAAGGTGEIVIRGANVTAGYENNPTANAEGFHQRLVPHRRPGHDGRRRLPDAHRAAQGDHQPRRREDLPARGRRGPDGPPGGRRRSSRFAMPHDKLGEEVAAAVVLRDGSAADRARAAGLRGQPRRRLQGAAQDPLLAEIPKGATGKLQRIGLAAKLGLV